MTFRLFSPDATRRMEEEAKARRIWREDRNQAHEALFLKRQQQLVDLSSLDNSTARMKIILDRKGDAQEQLAGLTELIDDFSSFIRRAEEKEVNTATLRRKLQSLQLRAYYLYKEMKKHERAQEFNERDLKKILNDYENLRK
ncbi:MAG: hypothetical protein KJ050_05355 [Candidatus Omnitrophica bacterium]|nr:hypothetical protein [Candidatus Omnitrophota bacterium]